MRIPPGYANVQMFGTNPAGRDWLTACGCSIESWDPETLDGLQTYLAGEQWVSNILADNYVITGVRVVIGTSDPSAPITYEKSLSVTGDSGAPASPNVALLVTKTTNLGGRKGRGRCFFPGPTESTVGDGGQIVGDLASDPTTITDFWPDLFTNLELGDPYLFHEGISPAPSLITGFQLSARVATQRRRLRG